MPSGRLKLLLRHFLLPVLGIALLFLTLAWGAWSGQFTVWLLLMMLVSVGVLIVGVVSQEAGTLRDTAASLVYCVCVLLAAIGFYLVTTNYSQRIDFTEHRIHSLSNQTVRMLESLEHNMSVTVFADARDHASFRQLFDLYSRHAGERVRFAVHDPVSATAIAREFDQRMIPNTAYIIVHDPEDGSELRRHRFALEPGDAYRESVLSNALQRMEMGSAERIYFLAGHQERPLQPLEGRRTEAADISWANFSGMVEDSVLPIERLELFRRGRVPEDAAAVIIASPAIDLNELEREILMDYLEEGGSLFVTLDPLYNAAPQPNLAAVLATAGIQTPPRELIDPAAPRRREVLIAVADDHPVTQDVSGITFIFNGVRELLLDPELAPGTRPSVEPILATAAEVSRLNFERGVSRTAPPEASETGRAVVGAASTIPVPNGTRRSTARVIVIGDGDFLSNERLLETPPALLGLNATRWLAEPDNMIVIPPRTFPPSAFTLTPQRFWLMIGLLLLVGVTLLGGGLSFALGRKKLG